MQSMSSAPSTLCGLHVALLYCCKMKHADVVSSPGVTLASTGLVAFAVPALAACAASPTVAGATKASFFLACLMAAPDVLSSMAILVESRGQRFFVATHCAALSLARNAWRSDEMQYWSGVHSHRAESCVQQTDTARCDVPWARPAQQAGCRRRSLS